MTTTEADKDMDSARAHPSPALCGADTGVRIIDPERRILVERVTKIMDWFDARFRADFPNAAIRSAEATVMEDAIEALSSLGEEFLEFKEALSDLRSLRQEHRDLTGGGPGWSARWEAAWVKVDDLFADEDEAAWERAQEGAFG